MTPSRRKGRPPNPTNQLADARCALDLAEEVLLRGTREFLVLVNQELRDIRKIRHELGAAA